MLTGQCAGLQKSQYLHGDAMNCLTRLRDMSSVPLSKGKRSLDVRVSKNQRSRLQHVTLGTGSYPVSGILPETGEVEPDNDLPDFFVVPTNDSLRTSLPADKVTHKARTNDITLLDDPLTEPSSRYGVAFDVRLAWDVRPTLPLLDWQFRWECS
eukprot:scaffold1220_cov376-Prasinococcus_capsulatus_cf.AAC.4